MLWVAALLASLLALEFLFRDDAHDGTLEQYALSGQSLTWLVFAKTAAHWLLTGVPLALMAPLASMSLGVPNAALRGIIVPIALGTLVLSLIGAIGAAFDARCRDAAVCCYAFDIAACDADPYFRRAGNGSGDPRGKLCGASSPIFWARWPCWP